MKFHVPSRALILKGVRLFLFCLIAIIALLTACQQPPENNVREIGGFSAADANAAVKIFRGGMVKVANPEPVRNLMKKFRLGDTCYLAEGGTLNPPIASVNQYLLVEYMAPGEKGGVMAPSHILAWITREEFVRMTSAK